MANKKKKSRPALSTSMPKPQLLAPAASAAGKKRKKKKQNRRIHPYSLIMIDPRTGKLDNAHPPDQNPRPTVVFRNTQNWTATTDTVGSTWMELRPLVAGFRVPCPLTSGAISAVSAPIVHDDKVAITAAFSAVRPMVMAVEVEYVGEAQLAKGTLMVCVSDNPAVVGWTISSMSDEPYYKELSVSTGGSVACIARYAPSEFYDITSTGLGTGHPRVFVIAEGMPVSTYCIRVRTTIVAEYLCPTNSLLQTQAKYSPSLPLEFATAQSINRPEAVVASGENAMDKLVRAGRTVYDFVRALQGMAGEYGDDYLRLEL